MSSVFEDDPELRDIQLRLQADDGEVRRIALLDLADFAGDEHVPLIIAALNDPLPAVRAEAARTLEAFETDEGIAGLIVLLDDPDQEVREAAAHGLHDLKRPESAQLLLPHLQQASTFATIALLRALRELRAADSFAPALHALSNQEAAVRREAITVLGLSLIHI